jgi:hypothetical protein
MLSISTNRFPVNSKKVRSLYKVNCVVSDTIIISFFVYSIATAMKYDALQRYNAFAKSLFSLRSLWLKIMIFDYLLYL